MKIFRFLPTLFLLFAATLLHAEDVTDKLEKSFPVTSGGTLKLVAEFGSVEVRSADVNEVKVTVERRVDADTKQQAQEILNDFVLEPSTSGNTLEIHGRFKTGWVARSHGENGNWNMCTSNLDGRSDSHETYCLRYAHELREHRYIVTIPRKLNLFVHTQAGHVSTEDVDGELGISTAGGHVTIGNVTHKADVTTAGGHITAGNIGGPAKMITAGGHIRVGDVNGDLRAETAGGHIEGGHIRGNVEAKTAGGNINIRRADGAIVASTVGGRIRATFGAQPKEDSRLESMAGGVDVELPASVKLDVDVQSHGGGLNTDFPLTLDASDKDHRYVRDTSAHGKLNGGGPKLDIKTSMGSVSLLKAEL